MSMVDEPLDLHRQLLLGPAPEPVKQSGRPPALSPSSASAIASENLMPDLCPETVSYRRIWLAAAIAIVALYAYVVFSYWGAADSGVDQNAYLVGGRLLAEHFSLKYVLPNPYAFTGGMFVRMPDGTYFPKYPFGLPLLYACFIWLFKVASVLPIIKHHVDASRGVYWAFLVSPISSVLGVAGMFFLARQIAGSFAAALAAILLGSSQLMLMLADNPNSHASCLAFIVWGMFFCVRWLQSGRLWHGILGGALVGYAATIRYNEGLLFAAMCVVVLSRLPWNQWKTWRSVTSVIALVAATVLIVIQVQNAHLDDAPKWNAPQNGISLECTGVLLLYGLATLVFSIVRLTKIDWLLYLRAMVPGLAWAVPVGIMLLVNHHTMGSFTGYDSTHESEFGAAFQWKFFWQNWEKVFRIFNDLGLFFIAPFAVAGVAMLFHRSWRIGLLLVAWVVPGVMLYMSYYWSPDMADAYARFFLTYLPALLVGAAVCFADGLLIGGRDASKASGIALTLAVGLIVATASGVSTYRSIHGMRDGAQQTRIPLHDFRQRLALAQTGKMLLEKVPEKSVLFAENTGGISTPCNYIQFLRDWELYGVDTFSMDGARRGFPARQRNNRNNNNRGGRGNFAGGGGGGGGGFGGPPGGGMGGGMGGGPPGGGGPMANANGQNDPTNIATPVQPEQQEYHASLYKNKTARQLYQIESDVINSAIDQGRRAFVVVAKDHSTADDSTNFGLFGNGLVTDPMESFRDGLTTVAKYNFKVLSRWQDVSLPEDASENFAFTDNSPMGGGANRGGNQFARMLMGSDRVMDWELVEIVKK
jgi:hypothetical protein